ncbi:RNA polymerase sigma factor [Sphingobacterium lumbrici]|uniref:RNA polymerase sigma factor n=1 Tax=Sphingobacterium lumbrici TaxID=2559600 RepID=UPI00112E2EDF|nr:sigma-70 family RNA polymerase sigma factor [Sphingobacterium lumbrici]
MSTIDEKELLFQMKGGDVGAFDVLYNRYKTQLAANLFKLLKSWDQVEEVLQELFVRVWENRKRIDPEKPFNAYLYRIGSNLVNDYFRKLAKDRNLAEKIWENMSLADCPESLRKQILEDQELMRTIDKLPPQRQLVFKLCKLEGKSYAEVSELLKVSEAAVNDHITKANRFILQNYNRSISLLMLIFCTVLMDNLS